MPEPKQLTLSELESGVDYILQSPKLEGGLALIVRRPAVGEREVLQVGHLDGSEGLAGDNWSMRASARTSDGTVRLDSQVTLMNARVIDLVAQAKERWPLAGDQLYVDLDLSMDNLPAGTHLAIGNAVIEVSTQPHTGCKKFMAGKFNFIA